MDYEEIIKAIREKTHKAQGDEHELYESLAFDSHSSFDYGVRITLYALSQVLGEVKVQKAMQNWLKGVKKYNPDIREKMGSSKPIPKKPIKTNPFFGGEKK